MGWFKWKRGYIGRTIETDRDVSITGDVTFDGDVTFNGTTTLEAAATVIGANPTFTTLNVTGAAALDGGITCDTSAFTVANTTGNVATAGTLAVTGASTLTGNVACGGTLTVADAAALNGGITVDSTAFTVANTSGNTAIAGTLAVTGTSALTGAVTVTGALNANGGFACDTNRFTVADTTGNTAIAGTLAVTGTSTLSGNVSCGGTLATTGAATLASATITGALAANGGITCDTNKFTVADTSGNTAIGGTLTVTGVAALNAGITVDTNKFTVADGSGNTLIAGTLAVTGASTLTGALAANGGITVDSTAFTVADTSGNTAIAGTLGVTGATTVSTLSASGLVGSSVGSAAASETALILGAGTNAAPSATSTANKNFLDYRVKTTATTGDTRALYLRTEFGGIGVSGESVRANSVLTAAANTVHGVHGSVGCNAGGSVTGLGVGVRGGILALDGAMTGGTYAAVQAELWANGSSTNVAGVTEMSAVKITIGGDSTGAANIEDNAFALALSGGTNNSGNIVSAAGNEPTWTGNTYLIRSKLNGQVAYLVAVKV